MMGLLVVASGLRADADAASAAPLRQLPHFPDCSMTLPPWGAAAGRAHAVRAILSEDHP